MKRNRVLLLILALVLIVGGSYGAHWVNTNKGRTDVERIYFDTDRGTLSGLLYLPEGVSAAQPRPAVIVTHGYLNSGEMQDLNAIELSRRGYVVLALDMYDHGHSKANEAYTGSFMNFWPTAMWDAANYMYQQPYVLKDEQGNGIIGLTGHSMGGFSSSMAIYEDEKAFAQNGYRVIYTSLTHGSDYYWTGFLGLTTELAAENSGGRTLGKLAAQFDEFFFNPDPNSRGAVVKKNYVGTDAGKVFLEQDAPVPGTWYDTSDGGKRIVYQPYEIHPWNHFSTTSTAHTVDFYTTAFNDYNQNISLLPSGSQIWLYKELAEGVALAGFFLLILALGLFAAQMPILHTRREEEAAEAAVIAAPGVGAGLGKMASLMFAVLLPAIFFPAIMDKNLGSDMMMLLTMAGLVFAIVGLVGLVRANEKRVRVGALVVLGAGLGLALLTRLPSFTIVRLWSAPTTNQIAFWALISICFSLLFMGMTYLGGGEKQGVTMADYGLRLPLKGIAVSLLAAGIITAIGYAVVFAVDALWQVDFRLWVLAFKTFEPSLLIKVLPYLLPFFLYYLVSGAAIFYNTRNVPGCKGCLLAMLLNAGGIALYLIVHYGLLFATGTALFPTQPLSSILLIALTPTLMAAAVYTRAWSKETGNVWLPAFLNALLMTIMTLANTCVYFR